MASMISLSRHFTSRSKLLLLNQRNPSSNSSSDFISGQRLLSLSAAAPFSGSSSSSSFLGWSDSSSPTVSRVLLASLTSQAQKPINPNTVSFLRSFSSAGSSATGNFLKKFLRVPSSPSSDQSPPPPPSDSSAALANEIQKNLAESTKKFSDAFAVLAFPEIVKLGCFAWFSYATTQTYSPLIISKIGHPDIEFLAFCLSWAILLQRSANPTVSLKNNYELSRNLALVGLAELGYGVCVYYATTQQASLFPSVSYDTLELSAISLVVALILPQIPKLHRLIGEYPEQIQVIYLRIHLRGAKFANRYMGLMRGLTFLCSFTVLLVFLYELAWK